MYFDLVPDRAIIVCLRSSAQMAFHFANDEWMKAFDKELGLERFNEDIRKRREYHNILLFADKVLLSAIQKSTVEQLGRLLAYPFANSYTVRELWTSCFPRESETRRASGLLWRETSC